MSYETLDVIADAYIPVLLGVFLVGLVSRLCNDSYRLVIVNFFAVLLAISYGIMFIDGALGIFPAIELDYSTHTAVALSLVYALCLLLANQWKISLGLFW